MRVLLTTPYDLAVPGGVNRHARDLLDALTVRGVEAKLAGPASAPVFAADPRIVRIGRVRVGALNGAKSRVTLDLGLDGAVRRLMRDFRPDVLHVQEPFAPTLNTFFLLHAGSALRVGTFHTYSETSRGYLWTWPWCALMLAQLDVRAAVSPAAREFATRYHPAEMAVVPHGVRLPAQARPARPPGRPVRLLFVGRIDEPRKGFGVLIEALRRLEAERPGDFALTAVGGGELWREAARGLPVTFAGEAPDDALGAFYDQADIACVPSLGGESFGLVALEALAHGVPVVASAIRGYRDWLDGAGAGMLAPPGDAAGLAAAIGRLAGEPGRLAAAGRAARRTAGSFSWDARVEEWLALYRRGGLDCAGAAVSAKV